MSRFEYEMHEAKRRPLSAAPASASTEREKRLHERIANYCRGRGWITIHSRMDRASTCEVGTWDFIILMHDGRKMLVEAKVKGGKMKPEQMAKKVMAEHLGHRADVVWSYEEFLSMVKEVER